MIIKTESSLTTEARVYLESLNPQCLVTEEPDLSYYLSYEGDQLLLKKRLSREHGISVDFVMAEQAYRRQKISRKKDLLAKAVGLEPGLKVCDLTMGLAGDAFKLVFLGAEVTAIEQNEMLCTLVRDACHRYAKNNSPLNLQIHHQSFLVQLESFVRGSDVIYFDPMYEHERSALPRKEMQYLAALAPLTSVSDQQKVLECCRELQHKLVVKRAPQAEPLGAVKPHRSVFGKMVRFDVYTF